jgi:hypothetical protein
MSLTLQITFYIGIAIGSIGCLLLIMDEKKEIRLAYGLVYVGFAMMFFAFSLGIGSGIWTMKQY